MAASRQVGSPACAPDSLTGQTIEGPRCIACDANGPFIAKFAAAGGEMVRCPQCGLVFQDAQPSDERLAGSYYHDPAFTAALLGQLRVRTIELAEQKLRLLRSAGVPPGGRALDIGCSSGAWLEVAKRAGWQPIGVELGAATAEAARAMGLAVHTGTLADHADELLRSGPFDLVTFWDVLEHLRRPQNELNLARSLLSSRGVLAITCPNVEGWFPRLTYSLLASRFQRWEYPELPLHLYDFSPRTISLVLDRAGYKVTAIRTFGTAFSHYRGTTISPQALGGGGKGFALRAAFEVLHALVYPVARVFDRGNSMLVLATPRETV